MCHKGLSSLALTFVDAQDTYKTYLFLDFYITASVFILFQRLHLPSIIVCNHEKPNFQFIRGMSDTVIMAYCVQKCAWPCLFQLVTCLIAH